MKSVPGILALAAAGLFVHPIIANAQATNGAFINGNIGTASLDSGPIDGNETSYGVNAGFRWAVSPSTLIGFEAGYLDLGRFSGPTTISLIQIGPIGEPPADPVIYPGRVSTKVSGWTIGANGHFLLSPNWYLGARAGFFRASVDTHVRTTGTQDVIEVNHYDGDANGWYAGAGFGYDFSNNLSLGLNYDHYNAKKYGFRIDPDVISVAGEYRF